METQATKLDLPLWPRNRTVVLSVKAAILIMSHEGQFSDFFDFEGIVHQEFFPPGQVCCKHLEEWHSQAWLVHHAIVSAHNGCDGIVFKIKLQLWEFHCNDVPEIQEHMPTFLYAITNYQFQHWQKYWTCFMDSKWDTCDQ